MIDPKTGIVSRREVTLGLLTNFGMLVNGIEAGEWIATAGAHYLEEGQRVRIMTMEAIEEAS